MADASAPLSRYQWQHRVIVVFAADRGDAELARQLAIVGSAAEGLSDRDLVVITVIGDGVAVDSRQSGSLEADPLRRAYGASPDEFLVLLIGKDGGVKLRSEKPVTTERLFALIDAMPMRQREMRQREMRQREMR